ncbi:hypothetical protein [Pseudomonas marginalis]|uniref:hypothetical protein n=1 Tax=Pseudomonas marginalis TaxID=298 RepID=UPI0012820A42|nr:hypothetical protein [Pseudomonas marginalis]KAA8555062.1 hypothetical protein FX984_01680 [Pseudomonas marginalis]
MDFPKSVPSVGLVDGKFVDEDPLAGTPGSLIPSEWGNSVTLEILKVIEDGGLTPDEDDKTQLSAAIQNLVSDSVVPFASQVEAEDGTINNKSMSPLRVFQAIAKVVAQATETAFGWLKIGTQTQVNTGANDAVAITPKKMAAAIQVQAHTAFATGGTSAALTLAPSPAITAYVPNQRFQIGFSVASTGGDITINISGLGPKLLKQYNSAGVKVPAVFAQWQISDVVYDSVDFVLLDQLPTATNNLVGIAGTAKNLRVSTTGTSAVVTVSADELVVESTAGAYATLREVAVAPSFAVAGVNGWDVGAANSQPASTWCAVWVIWNSTTKAGLLSLSGTAPTLPAGYTHAARVGWVRTDSTANKFPLSIKQFGRRARYVMATGSNLTALPTIASGAQGALTPTLVAASIVNHVPLTAAFISVQLTCVSGSWAIAAPNGVAPNSLPALQISNAAGTQTTMSADFLIESTSVYYAGNGSSALYAAGWEDNL